MTRKNNGFNANGTHQIAIKNIPAGSGKIIAVVANINLDIFDMTTATLDAITAYPDLLALTSRMQDKFIERGAQFLMSGTTAADLTANTTNPVNVSLKRVDVKIRNDGRRRDVHPVGLASGDGTTGGERAPDRGARII